jgi:hypothetical protein
MFNAYIQKIEASPEHLSEVEVATDELEEPVTFEEHCGRLPTPSAATCAAVVTASAAYERSNGYSGSLGGGPSNGHNDDVISDDGAGGLRRMQMPLRLFTDAGCAQCAVLMALLKPLLAGERAHRHAHTVTHTPQRFAQSPPPPNTWYGSNRIHTPFDPTDIPSHGSNRMYAPRILIHLYTYTLIHLLIHLYTYI